MNEKLNGLKEVAAMALLITVGLVIINLIFLHTYQDVEVKRNITIAAFVLFGFIPGAYSKSKYINIVIK